MTTQPVVVIIESDEDARYLYHIALKFQNLKVFTASTVADGLEVVKTVQPDLLLLDQVVPDLNNHNLLAELKGSTPDKMPIIIATNLRDHDHKQSDEIKVLKAFEYLVAGENTVGDVIRSSRKAVNL